MSPRRFWGSARAVLPGIAWALWATLAVVALTRCHAPTVASPGPDASTAAAVCANLAKEGCALGSDPTCASRLELSISEQRVLAAQIACAKNATTKAELVACSPYFACP